MKKAEIRKSGYQEVGYQVNRISGLNIEIIPIVHNKCVYLSHFHRKASLRESAAKRSRDTKRSGESQREICFLIDFSSSGNFVALRSK